MIPASGAKRAVDGFLELHAEAHRFFREPDAGASTCRGRMAVAWQRLSTFAISFSAGETRITTGDLRAVISCVNEAKGFHDHDELWLVVLEEFECAFKPRQRGDQDWREVRACLLVHEEQHGPLCAVVPQEEATESVSAAGCGASRRGRARRRKA